MSKTVHRYLFNAQVPTEEVEATLLLAVLATQALHGEASTRLDGGYFFDPEKHACVIDSSTQVGRHFNRLFVSFIIREFGSDAFSVTRIEKDRKSQETAA